MVVHQRKRPHHMTWSRVQEEFQPVGRHKLVKRSTDDDGPPVVENAAASYRKIGQHMLVLNAGAKPVDPVLVVQNGPPAIAAAKHAPPAPRDRPEKEIVVTTTTSGTFQSSSLSLSSSTAILPPRKLGRHKLVFNNNNSNDNKNSSTDRQVATVPAAAKTLPTSRPPPTIPSRLPPPYAAGLKHNKLVFSSKTGESSSTIKVPTTHKLSSGPVRPMMPPRPPPRRNNNKLVFCKTTTEESRRKNTNDPSVATANNNKSLGREQQQQQGDKNKLISSSSSRGLSDAAAASLKHLRANYKATKSGLKRVEPPVCKFFQQKGMCFDDHCPYRHVKVGRRQVATGPTK